jgi:hypothetical protein
MIRSDHPNPCYRGVIEFDELQGRTFDNAEETQTWTTTHKTMHTDMHEGYTRAKPLKPPYRPLGDRVFSSATTNSEMFTEKAPSPTNLYTPERGRVHVENFAFHSRTHHQSQFRPINSSFALPRIFRPDMPPATSNAPFAGRSTYQASFRKVPTDRMAMTHAFIQRTAPLDATRPFYAATTYSSFHNEMNATIDASALHC